MEDEAPRFIPVAQPWLAGRELEYVEDAVSSTWVSSTGGYVDRFERREGEWRIADRTIVVEWNRVDEVDSPGFGPGYTRGAQDHTDLVYRHLSRRHR